MAASERVKLTAGRVQDFTGPAGDGQVFKWDSEAPGLAVRATATSKSYVFQGKLRGATIRITIGNVKSWLLDNAAPDQPGARQEARRLQTLIDRGIDPRVAKVEQAAAQEAKRAEMIRRDVTVAEAWAAYLEDRRPHWGERHYDNHAALAKPGGVIRTRGRRPGEPDTTLPGPIHSLLSLLLTDLTDEMVKNWLRQEVAKGPTQAEGAYRKLRAFINWCSGRKEYAGIVPADACTHREVRDAVPKVKAKADCLQREQLPAWFAAVRSVGNPIIAAYLQTLLLTGARREEWAGLRWGNVDFKWKSLTIKDKVEGERTIPLTPHVEHLLLDLKRRNDTPPNVRRLRQLETDGKPWKPSPWVFTSATSASGRLAEPRIAHQRALAVAGIEGLTLHGLRRSFGTLSEWTETPVGVVAQIMGHKPSAIAEKHYRVRPLDLLRMWHVKLEAWILEQAGIEAERPAGSVVSIAA